jgi:hypothetical protein
VSHGPSRRAGGATGLGDAFPGGNCSSEIPPKAPLAQEAIAALQLDFVAEALRITGFKALHAADDLTLGDGGCAECGIPIAIQNLREATTAFRRLQKLNDARSALRRQEDGRPHEYQVLLAVERSERQALAAFMQENPP